MWSIHLDYNPLVQYAPEDRFYLCIGDVYGEDHVDEKEEGALRGFELYPFV